MQSTLLFLAFWCYVLGFFLYIGHVLAVEPARATLTLGYSTAGGGAAASATAAPQGLNLKLFFGRAATTVAWIGWVMHATGLALRGFAEGYYPVANAFEAPLAFSLGIVLIYLLAERAIGTRVAGWVSLGIAIGLMFYSLFTFSAGSTIIDPLKPALRSVWLQIHVSIAILSYSFFALAGAMGVAYLLRLRPERAVALGSGSQGQTEADDPGLVAIDEWNYRAVAIGLPLIAFTLMSGAVWAQMAWATYWSWDPKEVWALITFLYYAIYMHARVGRGWHGRRMAILAVVGFGVVVFSFLGLASLVHTFDIFSLHTFGNVQ
jgi:cytochrome c-type biogenesis protein CcsB